MSDSFAFQLLLGRNLNGTGALASKRNHLPGSEARKYHAQSSRYNSSHESGCHCSENNSPKGHNTSVGGESPKESGRGVSTPGISEELPELIALKNCFPGLIGPSQLKLWTQACFEWFDLPFLHLWIIFFFFLLDHCEVEPVTF